LAPKKKSPKQKLLKKKSPGASLVTKLKAEIAQLKRQSFVAERLRADARTKKLKRSEQNTELLAQGVAHEFNNILGALEGHADWALAEGTRQAMREALQMVQLGCERSLQITRALQSMHQSKEEEASLFSLLELAREVVKLCSKSESGRLSLSSNISRESQVYGSRARLFEVFLNLIKNALEAAPHGTAEVRVGLSESKSSFEIVIDDNGPGVATALREVIFQPFFTTKGVLKQVAAASKQSTDTQSADSRNAGQGSGLGLFLARSVVTVMNGELTLEPVSAPDLGGARFKIVLPRVVNR
jgi:signal transduction histidine kinase